MTRPGIGGAIEQSPDVKIAGSAFAAHLPAHPHPPSPGPPVIVEPVVPPLPDPPCPDVAGDPPHATNTTTGKDKKTQRDIE
jgi:hypothetical protein